MNTKEAKETVRKSMVLPQPAPYIDAEAKYAKRRKKKLTQADIGLLEAQKFTGYGHFNEF